MKALNLATKLYAESKNGLLICGLNWGGEPLPEIKDQLEGEKSFFSDQKFNDYPYKHRIMRWFQSWGHPLAVNEAGAGGFERSITQTNWWSGQSQDSRGVDITAKCLEHRENFFFHLDEIRPSLIIFLSVTMHEALNHQDCIEEVRSFLGRETGEISFHTKEILKNGGAIKRFRVSFQRFEHCDVIALPHPTGSVGLADEYIAAFKPEIEPFMLRYKMKLEGRRMDAAGEAK